MLVADFAQLRFYSLKVSTRGQTRRAPTAATWALSLLEAAKHGEKDAQSIIAQWNSAAARGDRVSGGKYLAVKLLLDWPLEVREFVLKQISLMGFEGFLTIAMPAACCC